MGAITGNGTAVTGLGGAAGYGETALARDDASAERIDVSAVFEAGFAIGGGTISAANLYVSTDGLISFGAPILGLPANPGALNLPFIAPFLADVDTRLDGEGAESGAVWVDVDATADVVTITWADVGFYRRNASLTNTVQLQLFDRGDGRFDAVLRYQSVEWTSGDLEGGWGGTGGTAAFIGYDLGTAAPPVTLAASGSEAAQLALPQTLGNTGVAGLWVFSFGAGAVPPPGDGADTIIATLGADTLDGGAGFDVVSYAGPAAVVVDLANPATNTGLAAGDRFLSIEGLIGSDQSDTMGGDGGANQLEGGAGHDSLSGRDGADTLTGGDGNDVLTGGGGGDALQGGDGIDRASYASATAGVRLDLTTPAQNSGEAAGDTLTSVEIITGSGFADTMSGDDGANQFDGGAGADALNGRGGADLLTGGAGDDTLAGGSGSDTLTGGDGFDSASFADASSAVQADLATGSGGGDSLSGIEGLIGSGHADSLAGDGAANRLDGGAGADTLIGRAGADTLIGGDGFDISSYVSALAGIIVDLTSPALNTGEALGDVLTGIEGVTGSAQSDDLRGDAAANLLDGGAGNDSLTGRDGNDSLAGQTGADLLSGDGGDDHLSGGDGNDTLTGGAGNDTLDGGAGNDSLNGGAGTDWVSFHSATSAVTVDLTAPALNKGAALGDTLTEIEGVIGSALADDLRGGALADLLDGGSGDDSLSGRAGADRLTGGAGNDLLDGGLGADTLTGGDGFDTATYASATTGLRVDLITATANSGAALGDILIGIEALTGSAFADTLLGSDQSDRLDGGAGNDALTGRGGDDLLLGGAGNDTLFGGSGADTITGGAGFDWANYASASTGLQLDLQTNSQGGDAAGDLLTEVEGISGSGFADTIAGDAIANTLDGGAGNDRLQGRAGADTLLGGAGSDTLEGGAGNDVLTGGDGFDFASYSNAIRADLANARVNTAEALGDRYSSIEGLLGSAFADDLRGDGLGNLLEGNAGNDLLSGRGGTDTLLGGAGDDTLDGGYGADRLDGGAGYDWVSYASAVAGQLLDLTTPTLNSYSAKGDSFAAVEAFLGSKLRDTMAGDATANHFDGNAGNDTLSGRGGDDSLLGGLGDDRIYGGEGADALLGGAGRDLLAGDAGNDRLDGGDGNDTMSGGLGEDWLTGGLGADRFEQTSTAAGQDWITDYVARQGDQLSYTASATKSQFRVTFSAVDGAGNATAEAFVTHTPSGQVLWVITDGAAMTDINLRLGSVIYDLI